METFRQATRKVLSVRISNAYKTRNKSTKVTVSYFLELDNVHLEHNEHHSWLAIAGSEICDLEKAPNKLVTLYN